MSLDQLPETRGGWEATFPQYQTRYLAWCHATKRSPLQYDGATFITWIAARSKEFRKREGIVGEYVNREYSAAFDAFLWTSL